MLLATLSRLELATVFTLTSIKIPTTIAVPIAAIAVLEQEKKDLLPGILVRCGITKILSWSFVIGYRLIGFFLMLVT
ncbi:hypothetical protein NUACC21_28890 [Scytonema sp. NUACC21]